MICNSLKSNLNILLQPGATNSPALNSMLSDYKNYHIVLIITGSLFLLIFARLSILFWIRYKRLRKIDKCRFERDSMFFFGSVTMFCGFFMALTILANTGTVMYPQVGFAGAVSSMCASQTVKGNAEIHTAFNEWLLSGTTPLPTIIQKKVEARLAWQQPKALICSALLAISTILSTRIWVKLIRQSRLREVEHVAYRKALLFSGFVTVAFCLLLMLMVIGNTQAALAPLSLTLFYG